MDTHKQACQGKGTAGTAGTAGKTRHCEIWKAQDDLRAYGINSLHDVDNGMEPIASLGWEVPQAARSHHQFPCGVTTPEPQPTSDRSPFSLSGKSAKSEMLIPSCRHFSLQTRTALKFAASRPPVTTATLIELDLNWILHNMNLRSDVNFENDLHFMPIPGKRAEQKRKEAQQYWVALAAELQIHLHAHLECPLSGWNERSCADDSFTPRLSQMFKDLRELLETLVPDVDHISITENLDVPFLMQQIENGVLDISRLARWLASLVKSHCAPMRDGWADQMTQHIEEGARIPDMTLLVRGIEKMFSVLEAMKLVTSSTSPFCKPSDQQQDVANHQIRTFRFYLVEDTVPFQQNFFAKRISDGEIDVGSCRDWYNEARQRYALWLLSSTTSTNHNAYASVIHGIMTNLFEMPAISVLPQSFQSDLKRLERLRSDVQDLEHLRMSCRVFDELHFWLRSGQPLSVSQDTYVQLQSRLLAIIDEQTEDEDPWQIGSADVALEIARAACAFCGHVEILIPDCVIQSTYHRLSELISGHTSERALMSETSQEALTGKAIDHARIFNEMTPLAMSEAQQQWQQQREQSTSFRPLPTVGDIARRVAHLGILHWKIWANLVYLKDAEEATSGLPSLTSLHPGAENEDNSRLISNAPRSVEMVVE